MAEANDAILKQQEEDDLDTILADLNDVDAATGRVHIGWQACAIRSHNMLYG